MQGDQNTSFVKEDINHASIKVERMFEDHRELLINDPSIEVMLKDIHNILLRAIEAKGAHWQGLVQTVHKEVLSLQDELHSGTVQQEEENGEDTFLIEQFERKGSDYFRLLQDVQDLNDNYLQKIQMSIK